MKVGVIRCSRGVAAPPRVTSVAADRRTKEGRKKKTLDDSCVAGVSADSRTVGALQRQLDNRERREIRRSKGCGEGGKRWRAEGRRRGGSGAGGGGGELTPACLFYLGAQHGYRCCAAPSH